MLDVSDKGLSDDSPTGPSSGSAPISLEVEDPPTYFTLPHWCMGQLGRLLLGMGGGVLVVGLAVKIYTLLDAHICAWGVIAIALLIGYVMLVMRQNRLWVTQLVGDFLWPIPMGEKARYRAAIDGPGLSVVGEACAEVYDEPQ